MYGPLIGIFVIGFLIMVSVIFLYVLWCVLVEDEDERDNTR
jgi:hypothetical protein